MEILKWLIIGSSFAGLASGLTVIAIGRWDKMPMKYAAVALSTIATAILICLTYINNVPWSCIGGETACETKALATIIKNLSFIIFHVASGRDALRFKQYDRRSTPKGNAI